MFVYNLVGVWGAMIAATLAWVPVYVFYGGLAEYMAGFVFFASLYASWTDRYGAKRADAGRPNFPDRPEPPANQMAILVVPLLAAPLIAFAIVIVFFSDFAQGGYVSLLYLSVCVASMVIALATFRLRKLLAPKGPRREFWARPR